MTPPQVEDTVPATIALTIDGIPVRNIWLLMLYASDLYQLPSSRMVEVENNPDEIPELVAELLTHAVRRRLRRNLTAGYRSRKEDLTRVRGRIALLRTERRQLLRRGRVACSYEELTMDTPSNRYVRAALIRLSKLVGASELFRQCRALATSMERAGVSREFMLGTSIFHPPSSAQGRLGIEDRQMLAAARLAFDLSIPTEVSGNSYIAAPRREGGPWIRTLFEKAVGGFYDVVLSRKGWQVRRGRWIDFPVERETTGLDSVLPSMRTDIELERKSAPHNRIVIDTKFTSILKPGRSERETLSSRNIYQIYTYVRSQESSNDSGTRNSSAVLLYPSVGLDFDETAIIQGHDFRFLTVDLAADTQTIREQLLCVTTPELTEGQ